MSKKPRSPSTQRALDILVEGEALALDITCPNEHCAATPGQICRPYTHWVRVRDALLALPREERCRVMLLAADPDPA